jgi:hypothetical protein
MRDAPAKSSTILQFAAKVCIAVVVISAATLYVAERVMDDFESAITVAIKGALGNTTGAPFWGRVERELDRAADPATDLPPEKKQKLLNDVRMIVARWRPFIDTIQDELQKPSEIKSPSDVKSMNLPSGSK